MVLELILLRVYNFKFMEMAYDVGKKIWDCDVVFTNCASSSLGAI